MKTYLLLWTKVNELINYIDDYYFIFVFLLNVTLFYQLDRRVGKKSSIHSLFLLLVLLFLIEFDNIQYRRYFIN